MSARQRKSLYHRHRVRWVTTDSRDHPIMSLFRKQVLTTLKLSRTSILITREKRDSFVVGYQMRSELIREQVISRSVLKIRILLQAKI